MPQITKHCEQIILSSFSNQAQYRPYPYNYKPAQLADIIDAINVVWYANAYFCPNSSMVQPYWENDGGVLCQTQQPFEITTTEPKDSEFYQEIIAMKSQNPTLKVILSIGGWQFASNFYSQMVSDISSRSKFIASAKSFIQKYGFDGIDLNWENPKFCYNAMSSICPI